MWGGGGGGGGGGGAGRGREVCCFRGETRGRNYKNGFVSLRPFSAPTSFTRHSNGDEHVAFQTSTARNPPRFQQSSVFWVSHAEKWPTYAFHDFIATAT